MDSSLSNHFVDTHFHAFDAGVAVAGARYVPQYDAALEAWQKLSAPLGVQRGVLVQTSFMGTDNRRLLGELKRQPQLLRGVAVLSPTTDAAELARLDALGVRGIRLNLAGASHEIDDWRSASNFWTALLTLGWHLELHTDVGALPQVLAQLPSELALVLDHMGKPAAASAADPTFKALARRSRQAPVRVKLSGAYRLEGREPGSLAKAWLGELGVQRLLWGSDWPCTNHEAHADYPQLLNALYDWVGDEAAQQILVTNPVAFYWPGAA